MNINGTGARNITNNSATEHSPTWSPDGSRIAYVAVVGSGPFVATINPDAIDPPTTVTRMTYGTWTGKELAWSPRSDKLAYASNNQIRVMNLDGTGDVLVAQGVSPAVVQTCS